MKKVYLLVMVFLLLMSVPVTQAAGNSPQDSQISINKIAIDSSFTITKFSDGRVGPVENPDNLSETQLDRILVEMGVNFEEINKFPMKFKKSLVSRGGKKVDLQGSSQQYYNSLDGNRYLITEENKYEIDAIKAADITKLKASSGGVTPLSIPVGSTSDGIWSANSIMFYNGKTANQLEYIYDLYSSFNWSTEPNFFLTDSIAQAWDTGISSASSNGALNYRNYAWHPYTQIPMTISRQIGATKGNISLQYAYDQYGALHDSLRVPVASHGLTKQLVFSYVHPWIGGAVGVILTYLSIDWKSFTGDEWHWDGVFTVGNS